MLHEFCIISAPIRARDNFFSPIPKTGADASDVGIGTTAYSFRLSLSSRKFRRPMVVMPYSSRRTLMLSPTTMILRKKSGMSSSPRRSCSPPYSENRCGRTRCRNRIVSKIV